MNFFIIDFAKTPGAHTHTVTKMNKRNQMLDNGQFKVTVVSSDNDRSKDIVVRPKLRGLIPGDVLSYCGHWSGYGRFFYFMDGRAQILAGNQDPKRMLTYTGIVKIPYDKPAKTTGVVYERDGYEFLYADKNDMIKTWVLDRDVMKAVFLLHSPW